MPCPTIELPEAVSPDEIGLTLRRLARLCAVFANEAAAAALEFSADLVERSLESHSDEVLSLRDAAVESGYSRDHLARLVREGKIPNAGRPKAPRVLRRHLPRKSEPTGQSGVLNVGNVVATTEQIVQSVIEGVA